MTRARVALIGARRARQGLGPFVARDLEAAGLEVCGFLATSAATRDEAAAQLAQVLGREVPGHLDLDELVAHRAPRALAILSPSETHEGYLDAALERGLHVLCEKPLVWGGADPLDASRRLVRGFEERGLVLLENTQWPETLPTYRALFPGEGARPRSFAMTLSPILRGEAGRVDSLSHVLSMLQALAPAPEARVEGVSRTAIGPAPDPETGAPRPGGERLELLYVTGPDPAEPVRVAVDLLHGGPQPREAGYAVDGNRVRRLVRMEDYSMFLAAGDCRVDLPDPLALRARRFAAMLESPSAEGQARAERRATLQRAELFCALVAACRAAPASP